jgi:hypothetical protein
MPEAVADDGNSASAWSAVIGGLDGSTELRLYLHLRVEVAGDELYLAYLRLPGGSNVNVQSCIAAS